MKKYSLLIYVVMICLFTGCDKNINHDLVSTVDVLAEIDSITSDETEKSAITQPPEGILFKPQKDISIYENITIGQFFADTYIFEDTQPELENADELLDTDRIGICQTDVSYLYNGEYYKYPISYEVSDKIPPVVLISGNGSEVELGTDFELGDYVGYADNYDCEPELTYEGVVDTTVCGSYPLTATVKDSSGNETSWELCINVVEEISEYVDDNDRISFDSFVSQYAEKGVSFGIDVSRWQGDIDFEAVKNAGCSFVIMRIGHFYDEIGMDECYLDNMKKAKAAGLKVGVYIYTTANTEKEIKENAKWIAEILDGQKLDFPVVFDWEDFYSFQQYKMSIHDLNMYFKLFADEMEQYGYTAMLYSSKNFLNNFWYKNIEYPVWLAHYTDETDYNGEYVMWQATSCGRIDGIDGDVDLNILYGNID